MRHGSTKVLLFGFLTSFAVLAQPARHGEEGCCQGMHIHGGGWMAEKPLPAELAKELKLSAEQVQKIELLSQKSREESRPLKAALAEAHRALKEALAQPSSGEEELMAKLSAVSAAKAELQKSHMRFVLSLRQELGVEAWEKLRDKKFQKMQKGKKGKRGEWKHPGLCMEED